MTFPLVSFRVRLWLAGACLGLLVSGCSQPIGPDGTPVSGKVTFDGAPLESGRITFRDPQGQAASAGGEIRNGTYSFKSPTAHMTVEVLANREIPGKFDESNPGVKIPLTEQYIPEKYNTKSELTADVGAGKTNEFNFDLKN